MRTMMAAVVVLGLISGGYMGLIRSEPALSKAFSAQAIVTKGAEAAYQNAKLTREVIEMELQETIGHPDRGGEGKGAEDGQDEYGGRRSTVWLPYSKRLLQAGEGSKATG
jgi:hypothetical protein